MKSFNRVIESVGLFFGFVITLDGFYIACAETLWGLLVMFSGILVSILFGLGLWVDFDEEN